MNNTNETAPQATAERINKILDLVEKRAKEYAGKAYTMAANDLAGFLIKHELGQVSIVAHDTRVTLFPAKVMPPELHNTSTSTQISEHVHQLEAGLVQLIHAAEYAVFRAEVDRMSKELVAMLKPQLDHEDNKAAQAALE